MSETCGTSGSSGHYDHNDRNLRNQAGPAGPQQQITNGCLLPRCQIDPGTGAILGDVGALGDHVFADFDHDGTGFFGSGREDLFPFRGQLFALDETTPEATWISSATEGFGLNPFDTIFSMDPIASGGFAVHPVTGDLWGIEALLSQATVLYRIDRTTGLADSILKVGPPEYGYDALHILDDGTFLATRGGGGSHPDSILWEIDTEPDANGVVAIQPIPLVMDPAIVGSLNGLTRGVGGAADSLVVTLDLSRDTVRPVAHRLLMRCRRCGPTRRTRRSSGPTPRGSK